MFASSRQKTASGQIPQATPAANQGSDNPWLVALLCIGLAAITFAVFGQTLHFGFVNYDDNLYVSDNLRVTSGLSLKGITWVFTHGDCYLYHPLTMLSLMADYQLHGLRAQGYHFSNFLLHTASVVLLFLVLRQITGALWRSAFVAAVFAVHPLHVESVAWVAERKDVLSGFFFMLTLAAYVHYVRRPQLTRYLAVVAVFVFALLSKPTMVTLPFVLLLLDYWPLCRSQSVGRLVLEKLPLLALAAAACVTTVLAVGDKIAPLARIPVLSRVGNALVSFCVYLYQIFWPTGLAVFYPLPLKGYSLGTIVFSFFVLALISGAVLTFGRKRRWLLVGWLWYVGMLLPMIGIVQVGEFSHADRYTYLSQIGIYFALTWLLAEWVTQQKWGAVIMGGVIILLAICAWKQTACWKNSETLWSHAMDCTPENDVAHFNFGNALREKGRINESIAQYQMAVHINPNNAEARDNLGIDLLEEGKVAEALAQYQMAVQIDPSLAMAHNNLGLLLHRQGRQNEAILQYRKAIQLNPDSADTHYDLAIALQQTGNLDEAIIQYQTALQTKPTNANACYNLAVALQEKGRLSDAIKQYENALQIKPDYSEAHEGLGNLLQSEGKMDDAVAHYQIALRIRPDYAEAHFDLARAMLRKGNLNDAITQYIDALQIQPENAQAHNNLGGVYLQAGRADEAISELQTALRIRPNYAEAHDNLGAALLQNGRLDEAITQLQAGLQVRPNAQACFNLGSAYRRQGNMAKAIAHYREALQLEPTAPGVRNSLAWLLATCSQASLRNGSEALQLAREACAASHGTNALYLRTLAAACAEVGDYPQAVQVTQKAVDLAKLTRQQKLEELLSEDFKKYTANLPVHQ